LLGLPAMAGLIVLAEPMLMVLFMRGEFTANDAQLASYSLFAYGSGLLSFMLVKVLATGFYSRQDTKRPVRYGIIAMVSNMVFNIIFAIPYGYVGLAIATSMSAALNAGLLGYNLWRDGVLKRYPGTLTYIGKVTFAVGVMIAAVLYLNPAYD
ncbi:multidrug transporter MurJ, partial [Pseudidiomarina aestuarii]